MIDFYSVAEDFQLILDSVNSMEGFFSFDEEEIHNIKERLKLSEYRRKHNIDYDLLGSTFNSAYYKKNLLKNLLFFREIFDQLPHYEISVRDIGCGAAPSSSAISLLYRRNLHKEIKAELIDLSRQQIAFATSILKSINVSINGIRVKNYDINADSQSSSLSVFSYFLCEQEGLVGKALYQNRELMKGGFAAIDYLNTINEIYVYFTQMNDKNLVVINKYYSIPEELHDLFGFSEITIHGCYYHV